MLHLFNKVYLTTDDIIDITQDRVVISSEHGHPMAHEAQLLTKATLIAAGLTYENVLSEGFVPFIRMLVNEYATTRVVIYCDPVSFRRFYVNWVKLRLPHLTEQTFRQYIHLVLFNEQVIAGTSVASRFNSFPSDMLGDINQLVNDWSQCVPSDDDRAAFNLLNMSVSYELLLADYLSGSNIHRDELKRTMHMFLGRWFKEMLTDSRNTVLSNITNHRFIEAMGIDPNMIDISRSPMVALAGIPQLAIYADATLWTMDAGKRSTYNTINLSGATTQQVEALKSAFTTVYRKFEGVFIDNSFYEPFDWLHIAAQDHLTDEQLDKIVQFLVQYPIDTVLVPRFDSEQVNYVAIHYFLTQKREGGDLTAFRIG